jgi:hypothetical protein
LVTDEGKREYIGRRILNVADSETPHVRRHIF